MVAGDGGGGGGLPFVSLCLVFSRASPYVEIRFEEINLHINCY